MDKNYIEEYNAKMETVFAVLCPYCKHRCGVHAMIGCMHKDCYKQEDGCKYNGIVAVRNMMNDPNFKFIIFVKPKEKVEVQTTL